MKLKSFLLDAFSELKAVEWPTRQEAIKFTTYVIIISLATGVVISGIDYLLNLGLSYII